MDIATIVLAGIGGIALIAASLIHRCRPASIAGFSWHRSVDVYTNQWVERTSCFGPPANSRNHRSQTMHFRRPVTRPEMRSEYAFGKWQTRYVYRTEWVNETRTLHTFEVPKLRYDRTVPASGNSRDDVAWPNSSGHVGARRQSYAVEFVTTDGKKRTVRVGEKRWRALDEHARYRLRVTWYGVVLGFRVERH